MAAVYYPLASRPFGTGKCFWGKPTQFVLGQKGRLFSKDTDLSLAQSMFYAVVDKTRFS